MSLRNTILIGIAVLILAVLALLIGAFVVLEPEDAASGVSSFEECAAEGYPVMESYPRRCRTPDGRSFTEDIGNELEHRDLIRVNSPRPNARVASPLTVRGEARGTWYFEADFPLELYDGRGNIILSTSTQAQGEWMTEDFVPFEKVLEFEAPETKTGLLILRRSNPSGLPENEAELRIPIRFK